MILTFQDWLNNRQHGIFYYEAWTEEKLEVLDMLKQSKDPTEIMQKALVEAKDLLMRLPEQLGVVCGPISTGKRSVEENIRIFGATVVELSNRMPIFNQMPFEPLLAEVHELIKNDRALCPSGKTSEFFINFFYREIFFSGKKWVPHFIDGWEHSVGAVMEHRIFTELKSEIVYLPHDFVS